jgi:hypothetical protein
MFEIKGTLLQTVYSQPMCHICFTDTIWVRDIAQSFSSSTLPLVEFTALLPNILYCAVGTG